MTIEWIQLDPIVSWILRLALAALFATAAAHKLRDLRGFRQTLSDYEILPRLFVMPAAIGLVAFEVLIAIDLATGLISSLVTATTAGTVSGSTTTVGTVGTAPALSPWAGLAATGLLVIYGLAIGINLLRGRSEIDCGCLGPAARQPLSSWLLARNGILAFGAALTSLPLSSRSLHPIDGITLLGGVIVLALLFNSVNGLASDPSRWPAPEGLS